MDFLQQPIIIEDNKPKRGRPRKEVRKEEIEEVEETKIVEISDELDKYELTRVNINDIIPNVVNGVCVQFEYVGDYRKHVLTLGTDITSELYSEWRNGVGGIFNLDVKSFITHNDGDTYNYFTLIHEDNIEGFILRLVTEQPLKQRIIEMGMSHIVINDALYLYIKKLDNDLHLTSVLNKLSDSFVYNSTIFEEEEEEENAPKLVNNEDNEFEEDTFFKFDSSDFE